MLRGKLPPVWVDELQNVLWDAIEVGGALGVDQLVVGVHVDAIVSIAIHPVNCQLHPKGIFRTSCGKKGCIPLK